MSLVLPSCLSSPFTCNDQPIPNLSISFRHLAPQWHIVRVWQGIQGDEWAHWQAGVKHLIMFHFKSSPFQLSCLETGKPTLARVQGWPFFFASSWKSLRQPLLFNPIYISWGSLPTWQSCQAPDNILQHSSLLHPRLLFLPVSPKSPQALSHGEDHCTWKIAF